jgi:cytochrome P450
MERRTFLTGAVAATGVAIGSDFSHEARAADRPLTAKEVEGAAAQLRARFAQGFDSAYVENAILPFFLVSVYRGERAMLPMIDVSLTKENALPTYLWGLISKTWRPAPDEGVTVFLQGLEKRGPDNRRKRIYMTALTPDLYQEMYSAKVRAFFDGLLGHANVGKPLMRAYLDTFWDIYWDLHLGVKGNAIPPQVREIGMSFNTVLAYLDPTQKIVYENYMRVRERLDFLKSWIDDRLADIESGKIANPEKTFAWYWLKNGQGDDNFAHKDVVFECFHNFVAFSQWGNSLYNVMLKLGAANGDPKAREWLRKTMESDNNASGGSAFPPLERFVMELFRTISPNEGSISSLQETRPPAFERSGYIISPHTSTSLDPVHWKNPTEFDPSRYEKAPTSAQVNEKWVQRIGMEQCPFENKGFDAKDGRKMSVQNSAFGTVFGVANDKPLPVCDYAGFAPFGFGYRRCPGEQLTINVFEDFLRIVWKNKIEFEKLDIAKPEVLPIGPSTVINDDLGFKRGV